MILELSVHTRVAQNDVDRRVHKHFSVLVGNSCQIALGKVSNPPEMSVRSWQSAHITSDGRGETDTKRNEIKGKEN